MGKDPNSSCHSSNYWPRWVTLAQVSMNPLLMVLGCVISLALINSKALASLDLEKELDRGIGYTACNALADDPGSLLAITMLESMPTDFEERVLSPMERRSYAISSNSNRLWAMPVGNAAVEFSVPDFPNRPLGARWINEKLLYLEVQIHRGPNTGIFWLIDLTSMDVLACEGWFVDSPVEHAY